ncbi:digalactosyldiacylglycerol synthase 1, chloroplastic isoform X1 [Capsicum chacoense]
MNFKPPETKTTSSASSMTAEKALSLITKGWEEVRSSADADLQLIKNRAKEFENFVPKITATATTEIEKLRPKLSEIRRVYSSPDFKWAPKGKGKLRIDLSGMRNGIVREKGMEEEEEGQFGELNWEPIKAFRDRLREMEVEVKSPNSSNPVEIFEGIKKSEFVEKVKSSLISHLLTESINSIVILLVEILKSICKEPEEMKGVPPLDVPELLAYLVRQSSPFLDQIGIRRDISDKIVESLCSKRRNKLLLRSLPEGDSSLIGSDNINDELDLRIASVLQSTGHQYEGGFWSDSTRKNVSDGKRHVAIVTTASLPWMTGTAVNPLFRAAYLAKSEKQNVTLLVPWLCKSDQELVYPNNLTFTSPEEQELYIRNWLEERVGFKTDFKISFYPGKFSKERRSIIPAGDTSQFIPSRDADIAILEEPEHLNWYHHGKRWTDKFNHVVGIVHTNYLEYIKREKNGALQAFLVKHINNWVTRAHCDKVLRLSAATQDLPRSVVCNVHGVNPKFLKIGEKMAAERQSGQQVFSKGAYFLGKMVWAKGYRELIDLLAKHKSDLDGFNMDVFGNGEDAHEVQTTARTLNLNVNFMKGRDHADDSLHSYKVFINPSISDVLCTATAEALAMGKFVVCADHPSNEFFQAFPNCLTYKTSEDFVAKVKEAMSSEPQPLTPEEQYKLSWEAATQRFMEYSDLDKLLTSETGGDKRRSREGMGKSVSMPNLGGMVDGSLAFAHYCLTGNELLRLCSGAIPGTRDYDKQHCEDLHLLPPQVESPIYGW